jgi:hypothetical protein
MLVLALLVLVKENRRWQAWTILIPFLLLGELLIPWLGRLERMPGDTLGFVQAMVTAWTAAWLLLLWVARFRPAIGCVLVVGQAVAVGVTCWLQQGLMSDWLSLLGVTTMLLPLPAALILSRRCCRSNYGNGRFMAWLLLWAIVGTAVADGLCTSAVLLWGVGHHDVSEIVFYLLVGSLMFGLCAYLLNLPFMVLTLVCPAYRDRLQGSRRPAPALLDSGRLAL